jgi:prenyltransferase beta subunit
MFQVFARSGQISTLRLIIRVCHDDRYLLRAAPGGPTCLGIAWPIDYQWAGSLGARIEAAALVSFGLPVKFVGVLSLVGTDLYVMVTMDRPSPHAELDVSIFSLVELQISGMSADIVHVFQDAVDYAFAKWLAGAMNTRIQHAMVRSVDYIEQAFTIEDGRPGWSQDFQKRTVGVLSSAQGLLALAYASAERECREPALRCLEKAQNWDGGWRVQHALTGQPTDISIVESTYFCLSALVEAGRPVDGQMVSSGVAWLLATERESGGWGASERAERSQVIATAFAIRILARLGYLQAMARGLTWLRSAQNANGGWGFLCRDDSGRDTASVAPTAHAVISLLAAGVPIDDQAVCRAVSYIRDSFDWTGNDAPWRSTSWQTSVDEKSCLPFRHYATPWALAALVMAGGDLGEPLMQRAVHRFLLLQDEDGSWSDPTFAQQQYLWAVHDAVFALRTIATYWGTNLSPAILSGCANKMQLALESILLSMASRGPQRSSRTRL